MNDIHAVGLIIGVIKGVSYWYKTILRINHSTDNNSSEPILKSTTLF